LDSGFELVMVRYGRGETSASSTTVALA
jgi:hypothetical protein